MARRALIPLMMFTSFATMSACSSPEPRKSALATERPMADLVLLSGRVHTLDPRAKTKTSSAIAVRAGEIVLVGSDDEARSWIHEETKVVDLRGRTVVPGLVDSHMHLAGLGARRFGIDLVGTQSLEEVKSRVARAARSAKPGEWIRGRGWDQNDWEIYKKKKIKFPSAADLDGVAPRNPVALTRIDGHAMWANSAAMQVAGVVPATKAPSGGEIVKVQGKPSGIFVDNAMSLISDQIPSLTPEQLREALRLAQADCLSAGLSQVHDMGIDARGLEALKAMDDAGELRLRVYGYYDGTVEDLGGLLGKGPIIPPHGSDRRLTVRGVKFFIDGALGSRGAALFSPYSDDKKTSGLLVIPPEVLEARVRTAKEKGFQVATHAIGDRGNRIVLDIYERVFGSKVSDTRPRVEHAQVLSPEDLRRFGETGVIASMQPTHATSDMPWAEERLGKDRIEGAYAWHTLIASNATIAAGSDAPVEDISPILGLYAAVTRKDMFGTPKGGWYPSQRMTASEALAAFTTGGAWASFRESEAGRLRPGFVADLTVLDRDPLTANEEDLRRAHVDVTIIAGKIEFARPGKDAPPAPPVPLSRAPGPSSTSSVATSSAAKRRP